MHSLVGSLAARGAGCLIVLGVRALSAESLDVVGARKACDAGSASACVGLAFLYEEGKGVAKDLAMALKGRNAHRELRGILPRHWKALADAAGVPGLFDAMLGLLSTVPSRLAWVEAQLPHDFPPRLWQVIRDGVSFQAGRFWQLHDEDPVATHLVVRPWWDALAGRDARAAFEAMGRMREEPAALAFLKKHAQPIPPLTKERLAALIAGLDANSFDERERASEDLAKLGKLAEPALRKALEDNPTAEVKRRIEELLQKLGTPGLPPDWLRLLRCAEVLESLNGILQQ